MDDMALVLKVPQGRPPYIGIEFRNKFAAGHINQDLVDLLFNADKSRLPAFHLQIEPLSGSCNIRLSCAQPIIIRFYRKVNYEPERLVRWMKAVKESTVFNFGHVLVLSGKHTLAKTNQSNRHVLLPLAGVSLRLTEES
jgi:hypothetical protein